MKNAKKLFVSLIAIGLLILSATQSGVIAQGPPDNPGEMGPSGDNFTIDTGEVTVKVTGGQNVPFYTFWDSDDNTTKYRVQFMQVFEFYDNNSNGVYDNGEDNRVAGAPYALPALSWEFSEVTSDSEGTHFDISSDDGMFTFANHITDEANSIKFDVIISDAYEFQSSDSLLALAFSLGTTESTASDVDQDGNLVSFNDAFFEVEPTAQDANGNIDVGLSAHTNESNTIAYMSYEQFSGEMVHDPTVGVQASALDDSDGDGNDGPALASDEVQILWDLDLSKGAASMASITATFFAVLIPVTIYRTRKQ